MLPAAGGRQVIDGIPHRVRTGVQSRDLPERFAPWNAVFARHRLWSADGTWERVLPQVQAEADAAREIDGDISADSTIVRAHQNTAGTHIDPPPRIKGGCNGRTPGRKAVAEPARPPDGGGGPGEGLDRSRGGFTTKVHLSADGRCRPLSLAITPGQRARSHRHLAPHVIARTGLVDSGRPKGREDGRAWLGKGCCAHGGSLARIIDLEVGVRACGVGAAVRVCSTCCRCRCRCRCRSGGWVGAGGQYRKGRTPVRDQARAIRPERLVRRSTPPTEVPWVLVRVRAVQSSATFPRLVSMTLFFKSRWPGGGGRWLSAGGGCVPGVA
ncbi:transposase [Streptomyces sp. NPDC059556]|uniref:transposase n=1 Tax=Streptomyces sp. NPDC059556 TaxID=3346863 RepID=UPI0036B539C8